MNIKDKRNTHESVLHSLSLTKIILPMVLGLGGVGYLIYNQFNYDEFLLIKWDNRVWFYLSCAVFIYVLRHLFYAYRLRILSDYKFSFRHAVELVFIWEFASAISPTSIGGSAVAVFFLSQEKISAAKAVSIVLYTVIIDTMFFLVSLFFLLSFFGPVLIRPEMESMLQGYGITFILVMIFMFIYGFILTWGLFHPRVIKRILMTIAKIPFIKRYRLKLYQIGEDVVVTSKELRNKPFSFHLKATLTTVGAWVTKFLTVNFIILALVDLDITFNSQFLLYARSQTMYVITQFSPTPGGSGIMEFLFSGFFSDYISKGLGSIGALLWRLITYYPYLIVGVIIIPNWIRRVLKLKRQPKW